MRIGYACLTVGVDGTSFKNCTMKNANEENLLNIIDNNLKSLENIIEYNIENNIKLFRITSDLIPFGSSSINKIPWWSVFSERLYLIGKKIESSGMRVSMHPGQYTVLNSPNEDVVKRAIEDLNYHAKVLDSLGMGIDSKIVLHIGGVYNDKSQAVNRFISNFKLLDKTIQNRIIIENDDKLFNIENVINIGEILNIPVVYDILHDEVLHAEHKKDSRYWINRCKKTWSRKDGIQKIHYSQQDSNKRPGAHSNTIDVEKFVKFVNEIINKSESTNVEQLNGVDINDVDINDEIDIMLEVKDKNLSAIKCINAVSVNKNIKNLELEWSKYKYLVLEYSPTNYNKIRQLLKNKNDYPVEEFYKLIDEALSKEEKKGNSINAALHIWGYFKNIATETEKNQFIKYLTGYQQNANSKNRLKKLLLILSKKYEIDYLLKSYYFH